MFISQRVYHRTSLFVVPVYHRCIFWQYEKISKHACVNKSKFAQYAYQEYQIVLQMTNAVHEVETVAIQKGPYALQEPPVCLSVYQVYHQCNMRT